MVLAYRGGAHKGRGVRERHQYNYSILVCSASLKAGLHICTRFRTFSPSIRKDFCSQKVSCPWILALSLGQEKLNSRTGAQECVAGSVSVSPGPPIRLCIPTNLLDLFLTAPVALAITAGCYWLRRRRGRRPPVGGTFPCFLASVVSGICDCGREVVARAKAQYVQIFSFVA